MRCSSCSPLGGISLWNRTIIHICYLHPTIYRTHVPHPSICRPHVPSTAHISSQPVTSPTHLPIIDHHTPHICICNRQFIYYRKSPPLIHYPHPLSIASASTHHLKFSTSSSSISQSSTFMLHQQACTFAFYYPNHFTRSPNTHPSAAPHFMHHVYQQTLIPSAAQPGHPHPHTSTPSLHPHPFTHLAYPHPSTTIPRPQPYITPFINLKSTPYSYTPPPFTILHTPYTLSSTALQYSTAMIHHSSVILNLLLILSPTYA